MKYIELQEVDSTNNYLFEKVSKSEILEPTVVFARCQKKGKGMGSNKWESEDNKNAVFSLCLFPDVKTDEIFKISLATSLAIYEYFKNKGVKTKIKWPNDIYFDDRKLGGILIENTLNGDVVKSSVIGIGINVNQENFSKSLPNPVSLKNITGVEHDTDALVKEISVAIENKVNELKDKPFADIRLDYLMNLYRFGEIVMWKIQGIKDEISGSIVDVKPSGKIVIQAVSGQLCECEIKQVKMVDF